MTEVAHGLDMKPSHVSSMMRQMFRKNEIARLNDTMSPRGGHFYFNMQPVGHRYRATVWTLSAVADAVEGNVGIRRHIRTLIADSPEHFKALIRDEYDDIEMWFGPISQVE